MATKTKKKVTEDQIIAGYMDHVLMTEQIPTSIYKFAKELKIEESEFYSFFGSIEGLQKAIWIKFYENTESVMLKNKEYETFSNKEKMLTFFYSFFELMTLNRSYVLFALAHDKNMMGAPSQLKDLKKHIVSFAKELIEDGNAEKASRLTQHNPKIFSEGAWLQFVFVLKFWMNDNSPGFEKTDMAIEKSINTIFDVFDNTPLENIIDFGKFLFKERMA
ncbi:TetR family transcriptional regulator C-terminal domain-containing protein [Maribacter sp. 2-571]|uniref:TetR family transcriptional regulator C-terminal domain-containing protein n=1 Tax=Maribacter sp. 2-571 TaxID=3417569 RepID=UPI003D330133